jgi:hypothetical protein
MFSMQLVAKAEEGLDTWIPVERICVFESLSRSKRPHCFAEPRWRSVAMETRMQPYPPPAAPHTAMRFCLLQMSFAFDLRLMSNGAIQVTRVFPEVWPATPAHGRWERIMDVHGLPIGLMLTWNYQGDARRVRTTAFYNVRTCNLHTLYGVMASTPGNAWYWGVLFPLPLED